MSSRSALTVSGALGHLRVAMQDAFLRASREHGLTPSQAELLCAAMAPAPVNRLAQALRCDRTNITHLVSRAVDRGWVHRQTDERDRRSSLIALTPEGSRLAESFIASLEHQLADLLAGWSPRRQQTAARLIAEIADTLDQAAPHRTAEHPGQPQD
jgi:DNA-binding MarR family transcriptional regulator